MQAVGLLRLSPLFSVPTVLKPLNLWSRIRTRAARTPAVNVIVGQTLKRREIERATDRASDSCFPRDRRSVEDSF